MTSPDPPGGHLPRAQALLDARRPDAARQLLLEAAARDPANSTTFCLLARAERRLGNVQAALVAAETAARCDPTNEWAQRLQADALLALRQGKRARDAAEEAVRLSPGLVEPHVMLARVLLALGARQGALTSIEAALQISPHRADSLNVKGLVLLRLRRFREAQVTFEASLRLDPTAADTWNNLGAALLRGGRRRAAIEPLRRALELDPHLDTARRNLRLSASSFPLAGAPGRARVVMLVWVVAVFTVPWAALVVLPAIILTGWYRRRTWFSDFTPFARDNIFKRSGDRRLYRVRLLLFALGTIAGLAAGVILAGLLPLDSVVALTAPIIVGAALAGGACGLALARRVGPR